MSTLQSCLAMTRVAVVGLSDDENRPAWGVTSYVQSAGKTIIPVNPKFQELMGETCYPTVAAIPGGVDLVNVFRRADACPDVVRDAIAAGAKGVWLQSGIVSQESRRLAEKARIEYVENRCLMVELMRVRS